VNDADYFAGSFALVPAGRAGDAHGDGTGWAVARWHEGEPARQRVRPAGNGTWRRCYAPTAVLPVAC
jgi:hypothetical protein